TVKRLAEMHAEWDERHAASLRAGWRPFSVSPDPDRPMRLGFVSADFGRHPVGYLMVRTLEALRLHPCEIFGYSGRVQKDDMTARISATATVWRETRGLSSEALAEQVRDDQIDILFDLGGHTRANRLLVFARKPAPIQITWLGYFGTT